ncbi:MAG TPA: CBS domain-containing protein [Flavobacteriaceae bacterium]|nr:CBS domain-containing protein [Flavobacteriaceae bacterium]
METTPYILKEHKPFTPNSKVSDLKLFFNETTFSHFPVVKDGQLLGMVSEYDIEGIDDLSAKLGSYQYFFNHFFVKESNNSLEILEAFANSQSNLIAVLNGKNEYVGYYDLIDVLNSFHDTPFFKHEGEILQIEKDINSYSFSEISQIIESNNGRLLGAFVAYKNEAIIRVTVKFSAADVNEIIQSFRRYDYHILTNHEEDILLEDLKNRSDYLQKYLNI